MTPDLDTRIATMRKGGARCREIAQALGIKEWRVWRGIDRAGLAGKYSAYRLDGDPAIPRKPDTRTLEASDQSMLDDAELLDLEAWLETARAGRLGWEARTPGAYLSRLERALRIARRRGCA